MRRARDRATVAFDDARRVAVSDEAGPSSGRLSSSARLNSDFGWTWCGNALPFIPERYEGAITLGGLERSLPGIERPCHFTGGVEKGTEELAVVIAAPRQRECCGWGFPLDGYERHPPVAPPV